MLLLKFTDRFRFCINDCGTWILKNSQKNENKKKSTDYHVQFVFESNETWSYFYEINSNIHIKINDSNCTSCQNLFFFSVLYAFIVSVFILERWQCCSKWWLFYLTLAFPLIFLANRFEFIIQAIKTKHSHQ